MRALTPPSRRGVVGLVTAILAGSIVSLGAERDAHAQVNVGVDGGFAYRSSTPKLDLGLAYGAHAAFKPIDMLSIGAYYVGYDLGLDGAPNTVKDAAFHAWGGRVRFTMPLPDSNFRPYGYLGMGYVSASYPVEDTGFTPDAMGNVPVGFIERDGHFIEVPIGLGAGYKAGKLFELSLDFALRPGFGFGGDAYEGDQSVDDTNIGLTGMLGVSIDL